MHLSACSHTEQMLQREGGLKSRKEKVFGVVQRIFLKFSLFLVICSVSGQVKYSSLQEIKR